MNERHIYIHTHVCASFPVLLIEAGLCSSIEARWPLACANCSGFLWIATFFGPLIWSSWSFAVPVGVFHLSAESTESTVSLLKVWHCLVQAGHIIWSFSRMLLKKSHFYIGCITWSCWCNPLLWRKDSSTSVASCWHAPRAMGWKTPGQAQKNDSCS